MKLALLLVLVTLGAFAVIVWAKTEDPTSVAKPISLYGTYNGGLVPIKVLADGSLSIQ